MTDYTNIPSYLNAARDSISEVRHQVSDSIRAAQLADPVFADKFRNDLDTLMSLLEKLQDNANRYTDLVETGIDASWDCY